MSVVVVASDSSNAVWGLVGVLVGGVATTVGDLVVQAFRRRDERRVERLDAEAGMRVVAVQLDAIHKAADSTAKLGSWGAFADADGWFATWEEERKRIAAAFARAGRAEQLDVVASGFVFAKLFRARAARLADRPLNAADRRYLAAVGEATARASAALRVLLEAPR